MDIIHSLKSLHKLVLLSVILSFTSCAPVYVPNTLNTPMLSEQGDLSGAVYGGTAGFEIQAAYAATDHLGVMFNGSFVNGAQSDDVVHDHNFMEVGAGYYHAYGDRNSFEIFGGVGLGDSRNRRSGNVGVSSKNVRLFIQPSFGIESDVLDGSAAVRLAYVSVETNGVVESAVFYEPALTAKLGYKNIKGTIQLGYSSPLTGDVTFDYQPLLLSLGISAKLNLKD